MDSPARRDRPPEQAGGYPERQLVDRAQSVPPDARGSIDEREHVSEEVDEDVDGSGDDHDAEHRLVVELLHALNCVKPDPRPREHRLHEHRPAEQVAERHGRHT